MLCGIADRDGRIILLSLRLSCWLRVLVGWDFEEYVV